MRSKNSFARNSFRGNRNTRNSRSLPLKVMKFATCAILMTLGLLLSIPFMYIIFIAGTSFHQMTFWPMVIFLGFLFGSPVFFIGLLGILNNSSTQDVSTSSSVENDVARMRYVIETDRMNRR